MFIGFAINASGSCFGISPYSLYPLCENPGALVVAIVGGIILTSSALYLLPTRLTEDFATKGNTQLQDSRQEDNLTDRRKKSSIILILAIAIGCTFATSSAMRLLDWQVYITKIPLHVFFDGINNEYQAGKKIDFYVGMEGYGPDCGFPNVYIWKEDSEETGARSKIWQLKNNDNGGSIGIHCTLFPVDVPKRVVHIGDPSETKALIINETGTYVAYIEDQVGRVFQVVDK